MTKTLVMAAAACVLLAACASPPGDEAPVRGRINVFISPMGEPFRGGDKDPYPLGAWFARADTDHDGALSWDEFKADAAAFFKRLDANGDGVLDGAEIAAYEQDVAPEILPRVSRLSAKDIAPLPSDDPERNRAREAENEAASGQETRPRAGLLAGAAVFGVTAQPEPVASADTDFDGKVTIEEWLRSARLRFDLLDLNHDGRIARAELPKTPAEKMAEKIEKKDRDKTRHGQ